MRSLQGFRDSGVERVYLEVTAENQGAIRLYERLGFRTVKDRLQGRRGLLFLLRFRASPSGETTGSRSSATCGPGEARIGWRRCRRAENMIHTYQFNSGLALLAEPMDWLESAAFTILVPAGCIHEPPDRCGLSGFTCEMVLRGAGERDSRPVHQRPGLPRCGTKRGSGRIPHAFRRRHAGRQPSGGAWDLSGRAPRPATSRRTTRSRTPGDGPGVASRRGRAGSEGDAPSSGAALSRPLGAGRARETSRRSKRSPSTTSAPISKVPTNPRAPFLEWPAESTGSPSRKRSANSSATGLPARALRLWRLLGRRPTPIWTTTPIRPTLALAYRSVPYRSDDYFLAWGAVGVLSGGMSARLFTEVRERRGLCYSVYATHHTLRDCRGRLLLCRNERRASPGNARRDPSANCAGWPTAWRNRNWTGSRRGSRAP